MEFSSPSSSSASASPDLDCPGEWKGGVPGCARCGNIIYDKTLLCILDKVWHPSCLKCSVCNKQLGNTCYSNGSNVLCYEDYIRSISLKCSGCNIMLTDQEYVRRVHGNVYHQSCFRCICCEVPLQTGDKFYLRDDDKLVCAEDYDAWKIKDSNQNDSDSECSSGSGKRYRTNLTPQQINYLLKAYEKNPKPSRDTRRRLCRDLGLDYRVVQVWFQNKRAKCKKYPNIPNQLQSETIEAGSTDHSRLQLDTESRGRYSALPTYHESLYKTPPRRINNSEWLTTVLAHDSVPPNVVVPTDILNGEINRSALQTHRRQTDRGNPDTRSICSWS